MTRVRVEWSPEGERLRGLRLPVEVRTPTLALAAETTTGGELDLEPGRYVVSARLPSGQALSRIVDVEGERHEVVLAAGPAHPAEPAATFASPRARQAIERAAAARGEVALRLEEGLRRAADRRRPPRAPVRRRRLSLPGTPSGPAGGASMLDRAGSLWTSAVEGVQTLLGGGSAPAREEAVRPAAPPARLRFFVARPLELRADPVAVDLEVAEADEDRAVLRVPPAAAVRCAQVLQPGRPPVNLALPTSEEAGCLLVVHREPGRDGLAGSDGVPGRYWVEVQLERPLAALLLGYRRNNALSEERSTAERLLVEAGSDPVAAALAAWSLLRFGGHDGLGENPERLRRGVPWLPDGPALHGELLALRGDHGAALDAFLEVRGRGLPLFSDGLSALHARLQLYARSPGEFAAHRLDPVRRLLGLLQPFLAVLDLTQPVTTFNGLDPARPDDDPLPEALPQTAGGLDLAELF